MASASHSKLCTCATDRRSVATAGELLTVEPHELQFPFELKKQISCSLQLTNKSDNYVAFKFQTTNPENYWVRPHAGVVSPRSTCDVVVILKAQKETPPNMHCKDKFLLQCVVASPGTTAKDINPHMFIEDSGRVVHECKLRVFYVPPPPRYLPNFFLGDKILVRIGNEERFCRN